MGKKNNCGWEVMKDPIIYDDGRVDLAGGGALVKKIIQEGDSKDKPTTGMKCSVHYIAIDENGKEFDNSYNRDDPLEFELNKEEVVKGFNTAVGSMKRGEKAHFTIESDQLEGSSNNPPNIPEDQTIVFEIELLDFHSENLSPKADGGIIRTYVRKPKSSDTATDGSYVTIHLTGRWNGRMFEDRDFDFYLGETEESDLCPAIPIALKRMGEGEKSKLLIKPEYGYGETGLFIYKIPGNATIEYTVWLKKMDRAPEPYSLDTKQSIEQAKVVKDRASIYYMQKNYALAAKVFEKANKYLQNCTINNPTNLELFDEPHRLKISLFLNVALCHIKTEDYYDAKKAAETVLEIDPRNVKGLYRYGVALLNTNDAEDALKVFEKCLKLEPENKATQNQITLCKHEIRKQNAEEARRYKFMMKVAEIDKDEVEEQSDEMKASINHDAGMDECS